MTNKILKLIVDVIAGAGIVLWGVIIIIVLVIKSLHFKICESIFVNFCKLSIKTKLLFELFF